MHKYNQVKLSITDYIGRRNLQVGDAIPSQSEFVRDCGYSLITVRRALSELEEAGIIERHQGRPARLAREVFPAMVNGTILMLQLYHNFPSDGQEVASMEIYLRERGFELRAKSAKHPSEDISEACRGCVAILVSGWITEEWLKRIASEKLPVMIVGNSPVPGYFPSISNDYRQATVLLYRELRGIGCRNIGLFMGHRRFLNNIIIQQGYFDALAEAGKTPRPEWIFEDKCPEIGGADLHGLNHFLRHCRGCDSLIGVTPELHSMLMFQIFETGIRNQLKLGVFAHPRFFKFPFKNVIPMTFATPIFHTAAEWLLERLATGDQTIETRLIPPEIIRP